MSENRMDVLLMNNGHLYLSVLAKLKDFGVIIQFNTSTVEKYLALSG
jgi:hypothetical protein